MAAEQFEIRANNGNGKFRPLSSLRCGESARIVDLVGEKTFHSRLIELGFIPGSEVRVRSCSPWRDPVEYEVRNSRICLRRGESDQILVHDIVLQ